MNTKQLIFLFGGVLLIGAAILLWTTKPVYHPEPVRQERHIGPKGPN